MTQTAVGKMKAVETQRVHGDVIFAEHMLIVANRLDELTKDKPNFYAATHGVLDALEAASVQRLHPDNMRSLLLLALAEWADRMVAEMPAQEPEKLQ